MLEENAGHDVGYVKVRFDLPDGACGSPFGSEGIWCKERVDLGDGLGGGLGVGPGDGLYEVANAPWFVYDISVGDVVRVERDADGLLRFSSVVEKGGHATLRVVFGEHVQEDRQRVVLAGLPRTTGGECIRYERAMGGLYAVDLCPEMTQQKYRAICDYLGRYEVEGTLSYEEGDREDVPLSKLSV